jgi:hypothetical protein
MVVFIEKISSQFALLSAGVKCLLPLFFAVRITLLKKLIAQFVKISMHGSVIDTISTDPQLTGVSKLSCLTSSRETLTLNYRLQAKLVIELKKVSSKVIMLISKVGGKFCVFEQDIVILFSYR